MSTKNFSRLFFIIFFLTCSRSVFCGDSYQGKEKPLVFVMKISTDIDARTNRYSELALEEAIEKKADLVILELDTYGGALNDAYDIRTRILNFEQPIYVFINKDAASAGALISIACDSIYMAKGASIGAATVVTGDGAAAPDKYQSYMRSIMRSTAEATGRNPSIAEAMVDEKIELDSISQEGKVITLSTSEAIKFGFCEGQIDDLDEIIKRHGFTDYDTFEFKLDEVEHIISLFMNPFISGILILIIVGGIYFELQTPGVGFPILASGIALVLYLVPYYLNGLADNWEILMFFVGIVLLALEIFVIPGFGIAGIAGLVLSFSSLLLVMLNNNDFDFTFVSSDKLLSASLALGLALVGAMVLFIFGSAKLADSSFIKKVALTDIQDTSGGYVSSSLKKMSMIGKRGISHTILRPSGKVLIEEALYDATSRGAFIEPGVAIEVVDDQGSSLKVKVVDT